MGFFGSLFKKPPPPSRDGVILYVSGPSGMVQTTDKQALSFSVGECRGFTPVEGQTVRIENVQGMNAHGLVLVADVPVQRTAPRPAPVPVQGPSGPVRLVWADIERAFGAPMGPLLRSLVELCFKLDPNSPANALGAVFLLLDWIPPGAMNVNERRVESLTPAAVWPFAATGGDLEHVGFLWAPGEESAMEDRPVVFVAKDEPSAHVIAPNLRSFLGLVACTGMPQLGRGRSDWDMLKVRNDSLADDEVRACMEAILTLPGVVIPSSPMRVIRKTPDCWFEDVAGPRRSTWTKPKDAYDALRAGWMRLDMGEPQGAIQAVEGLSGNEQAEAIRIRWRALYDLNRPDQLRRDVELNLPRLTRLRSPGGNACFEDLMFLVEESGAPTSARLIDALAKACDLPPGSATRF